jgi:hypothetical protein
MKAGDMKAGWMKAGWQNEKAAPFSAALSNFNIAQNPPGAVNYSR